MADKDFKVKHGLVVADNIGIGLDTPAVSIDARGRTDAFALPTGTTAQRPSGSNGMFRFNETIDQFEVFSTNAGGWTTVTLASGNSSVDADFLDSQPASYYTNIPARLGYTPLNSASYTAADILSKLITVDGTGSGLDADTVDGFDSTALLPYRGAIANGTNLNTTITSGWYSQNTDAWAAAGTNYPTSFAGALEVRNLSNTFVYQSYTERGDRNIWHRQFDDNTWSTWRKVWDSGNMNVTTFIRTVLDDNDAAEARTTLELGTLALQNANNVNITGGTIDGGSF